MDEREDPKGLDRMCARRVMGWTLDGDAVLAQGIYLMEIRQWQPTLIWSDALRVVDRMAGRGMWFRLQSPFVVSEKWHAGFTSHGTTGWNGRPDHEAGHDHPPFAITLAALMAVGAVTKRE